MADARQFTFQRTIAVEFSGKFPPDARALSGLGFVSVAVSKTSVTIRKSQYGIHSFPTTHLEIVLKKNSAFLRVSAPAAADPRLQELRAVATFMRVLSLFPSMQANAAEIAHLLFDNCKSQASARNVRYDVFHREARIE